MSAIGLLLGLLVLSYLGGMLRGARAIRGFGLPSGSEYLCLGFVLGSQVLDLIPLPLLQSFRPLLLVGAAWIAFVEGLGYTRVGDRAIGLGNAVMGVLGAALVAAAVGAAVWFAVPHFEAVSWEDRVLLAGGIATVSCASTRQAVRWAMLRHAAKGPLSDTLAAFSRASTLVPVVGVSLLLARSGAPGLEQFGILGRVGLTWGLGGALGLVAVLLIGRGLTRDEVWGVLVGTSLLSIGLAAELGLSSLAAVFALGLTLGGLSSRRQELLGMVRGTERPVLLPLAVLAGALLNLRAAPMLLLLMPLVLTVRALAELARGTLLTLVSRPTRPAGPLVGFALMSMGEVTLACAASLALSLEGPVTRNVLAVGVIGILAGEIVGPLALRRALGRAGELDAGTPEPERLSLDPGGSEA